MAEQRLEELHLAAWRGFITAHSRVIDKIDRELVAADRIPLHWYDVLVELFEAPEQRLRLHELAHKVVLSRSGLTRLVDKLEAAGLLRREPDPTDRRGAFAVLTTAGAGALRTAWPIYARGILHHFAQYLDDDEARVLTQAFTRMIDAVQG